MIMRHSRNRRLRPTGRLLCGGAVGAVWVIVLASTATGAKGPSARLARTVTGTATARLSPVSVEGSRLEEAGPVSGALTGSVRADLHVGSTFTASFTIHTKNGEIVGQGEAKPHGSGRYESFSGSLAAKSGTGRYAHIHGTAGLYGVVDRRTDKVTIQATGGHLVY
jgi:hypothetical protein